MATSGGSGSFEEKKSLVMRGSDLVLVDGKLVLGPCDKKMSPYVFPLTDGIYAAYDSDVYLTNQAVLKNVNLVGSGRNSFSLTGDNETYQNVVEIGTFVDGFGGVVYVKFNQTLYTYLATPKMFVVGACSWVKSWPSYNVTKIEITGVYDNAALKDTSLIDRVFGPSVPVGDGWYNEGDCRGYIRRYGTLEKYDGPTVDFEVHTHRPGKLTWDSNGRITNFT